MLLLFVARGLQRRLDAAWWLTLALAAATLALSLTKGLAFAEDGVLGRGGGGVGVPVRRGRVGT